MLHDGRSVRYSGDAGQYNGFAAAAGAAGNYVVASVFVFNMFYHIGIAPLALDT
jgi:hypothetical protein